MAPRIARVWGWKRGAPRTLTATLLALAALTLSCSEIATKPRALAQVTGVIQDRDGTPIAGATVQFFDVREAPPVNIFGDIGPTAWTTTEPNGAYSVQLAAGVYDVDIYAPDFSGYPYWVRLSGLTLGPGQATVNHRYGGIRVTGRLIGPGGAALSYGEVYAYGGPPYVSARSRLRNGFFSFLLPAGSYSFDANPTSANPGIPAIRYAGVEFASDTTIDLSVDGLEVSGTVFGPGGVPVGRNVTVYAQAPRAWCSVSTGPDGRYLLHLPAGEYEFRVLPADGYIMGLLYPGTIVTVPQTLDFDLSGVEWTGTVRLTTTNQPVPSVSISARGLRWPDVAGTSTDQAGQFRLVVRPNGFYDIRLSSGTPGIVSREIQGVQALNDSTFDLYVAPATP